MKSNALPATLLAAACAAVAAPSTAACKLDKILELPIVITDAVPTVPVRINGSAEMLILASSAVYSQISPAAASRLGLGAKPAKDAGDGAPALQFTTVREFVVGLSPLANVDFIVGGRDLQGVAGLIGQNLLRIGDVDYDLAHGTVAVMRPEGCADASLAYWAAKQPYSVVDVEPATPAAPATVTTAYLNGRPLRVLLNTGSAASVVSAAAARRTGVDASGIATFDSFRLGDEEIRNVRIMVDEVPEPAYDMVIGADFFRAHHLLASNSQHKLYFTYAGGPVFALGSPVDGPEPADAPGYARRAAGYAAAHEYANAVADLTRAITLDPAQPSYRYDRGIALLANGDVNQALLDFDEAIAKQPDYVPALLARAGLRLRNGDAAGAAADVDAADVAAPGDANERRVMAQIYERALMPAKAIRQNDLWIASHPGHADMADAYRARCAERSVLRADLDRALADCDAAVDLRADSAWIREWRAVVHFQRGEYAQAEADFAAALKLDPGRALLQYGRGASRVRLKQAAPGRADIAAAIKRDPTVAEAAKHVGVEP